MQIEEIGRLRMLSQQIARPALARPEDVVRHLGAMQAQDYLGCLWAVGARLPGSTEAQVEAALAGGAVVRTWPMRGTIHLVAAEDVRWMLDLLAPRVIQRSQGRLRQLGLDALALSASAEVVCRALEGGRQLTRPELYAALGQAGIAAEGSRGLHILGQLAHQKLICFGARAGRQPTFTLLDEWVPHTRPLPRDEALAALALRYVVGHGPATAQDLMWWAGVTLAEATAGLGAASPLLRRDDVGGQVYYSAQDLPDAVGPLPTISMLAPFDEFLIAYRDRSALISQANMELVAPGRNGIFNPILVVDGRVVGTWRRSIQRRRVEVTFAPWFEAPTDALRAAADGYGRFLELPSVVGA
jgi:hypothetical protein